MPCSGCRSAWPPRSRSVNQTGLEPGRQRIPVEVATDKHQLCPPRTGIPGAEGARVDHHVHSLNDDPVVRSAEVEESLHPIQSRPLCLQHVRQPGLKPPGVEWLRRLETERSNPLIVRVAGIELTLYEGTCLVTVRIREPQGELLRQVFGEQPVGPCPADPHRKRCFA